MESLGQVVMVNNIPKYLPFCLATKEEESGRCMTGTGDGMRLGWEISGVWELLTL